MVVAGRIESPKSRGRTMHPDRTYSPERAEEILQDAGVVRLSGEVPPEQWNRIGTKLIPKLRSASNLRVEVNVSVTWKDRTPPHSLKRWSRSFRTFGFKGSFASSANNLGCVPPCFGFGSVGR